MNNFYRKFNYHKLTKSHHECHDLPEHSNKPFKDSLTELIDVSDITDIELCKAMRVSNTTIANYRKGVRINPDKNFMIRLADFFDVKPSYFWEYRRLLLEEYLELHPDLLDVLLDISTAPIKLIRAYKENKYMAFE